MCRNISETVEDMAHVVKVIDYGYVMLGTLTTLDLILGLGLGLGI